MQKETGGTAVKESNDRLLGKIDEGKRDFLKKLAIGTAYAAPVIATFSLDGIRSKAFAQAAYSVPDVLSLRAVPAAVGGDYLYGPPPTTFNTFDPYNWVITYDRPMNPAYASAKICKIENMASWTVCDSPPPATDPVPTGSCGTCELTWEWSADRTQEIAVAPTPSSTHAQRLTLWLNHPTCAAGTLYRDTLGTLLPAFVGIADLCQPPV